eukprot:scaffold1210_cov410-Prasinococcus_capsulatus_cf.AAC.2
MRYKATSRQGRSGPRRRPFLGLDTTTVRVGNTIGDEPQAALRRRSMTTLMAACTSCGTKWSCLAMPTQEQLNSPRIKSAAHMSGRGVPGIPSADMRLGKSARNISRSRANFGFFGS